MSRDAVSPGHLLLLLDALRPPAIGLSRPQMAGPKAWFLAKSGEAKRDRAGSGVTLQNEPRLHEPAVRLSPSTSLILRRVCAANPASDCPTWPPQRQRPVASRNVIGSVTHAGRLSDDLSTCPEMRAI
jgi:hypothetical protein